ncbi:MAG TPA: RHS repeat-associated core domain-containing protein [Caldisericia bacterium]|nr:RHS repeat-associated core domain-containing protein [Caldisericia bacterium]HOC79888.1 RHS repeat-associated core domain-containing protein [Caldisericia bacterium]HOG70477.1 RHS repeat-associated core domain-containing protein [Caldisericia bacterium]HPA65854.1 RHS repeat-associated core domain-containing protein [Caldisericia bacterium]HQL68436.1 RHS repeat-associated core domain-containing protein [Caldisericia bacterium]
MYPQIRDIIPPNAIINSATLVTDIIDPNLPSSVQVNVNEITSTWDPRNFQINNMPSISPITAASGVWDLTSTNLAYRTLDITTLVGAWFSGTNQWGIAISTPITEGVELDFSLSPCPRIYIDYDLPPNSYIGDIDGGTWYSDAVCPGLWLPKRATYFNKLGVLQNNVKTRIFFDTSSKLPPFGFDNQSFRYVVGGNLYNNNNSNKTMELGVRTWSKVSFNTLGFPFHDIPITSPPQVVGPPPTPMTLPQCEEEIDSDGTSYPYGEISNQIVDYSSSISYVDIPVNTGWGQIWIKKGRRIRTGPHGNLKSTVYKPFAKPEMYIINDPTIVELVPQTNVPQDGSYDTSLPQPEFEQSIDIGATGPREDKMEQYFSGSQANWGTQSYDINPLNAAFELDNNDFSIPCHGGLSLAFGRTFSSASQSANGILGPGWHTNIEQRVQYFSEGYLHYLCASGEEYVFTPRKDSAGNIISYDPPPMLDWKVEIFGSGDNMHVEITDKLGDKRLIFNTNGTISDIITKQGGAIHFSWNQGKVEYIEDAYSGRKLTFTYDVSNRLVSVVGPDSNRNWTYEYDTQGNMVKATDPESGTWRYEYNDKHNIDKIYDPRNNLAEVVYQNTSSVLPKAPQCMEQIKSSDSLSPETITRNSTTRVSTITEPTGEETEITYNILGIKEEIKDDNDASVKFDYNLDYPTDITRIFNQIGDLASGVKYDSNRNIIESYDAYSNKDEYTYWPNGKIHTFKDKEGHITTYTWNEDGSLPLTIEDPLQRVITYQYDTNKNLIKIISPYKSGDNAETQFEYDSKGYVNEIINPLGKTTTMVYNHYGEMTSATNALNKTSELTYNKMGNILKLKAPSPDNYEVNYTYDANGNVTKIKNSRNYETIFEYNSKNLKSKTTNALNQNTYYEYDDAGKLTKVKDHKNNQTTLTYDNCGRLLRMTDQENKFTQTLYNILGQISGYLDNLNNETEIKYDKLCRPIEVKSPEDATKKYEYDKEGNIKKVFDPLNRQITYDYDNCYQVTKVTNNAGKYSTIEYWPSGQVKKTTDPLGHIAEYDYNKLGFPTSVKDNAGNETTTLYDDLGRCTKVTNPLNQHVDFEYDMYGNVTKSYNELGKYTTYEYDANGNCTKMTTPLGKIYQWTYDELDRVKKTISPLGFEYVKTYDDVGNLVQVQDPLQKLEKYEYTSTYNVKKYIDQINNETAFDYNDINLLSKVTAPKGTYQQYTYDKDNQLKTVTDPLGNIAQYVYNLGGELTERKLPNPSGGTTSFTYTYDSLGRRTGFTDEASQTTTCTYNDVNQVTRIDHPNGKYITSTFDNLSRITGVNFGGGQSFSFAYDQLSRTTSATDQHGTKSISYDAASRVTSVTDPFGDQTTISYDDDDRVTSVTTPLGATSTTYDNDSRPTQITLATGGQIGNTFDNINRLTHSDIPNGVDVDFSYNDASWVTQKTYSTPDPLTNNRNENDPDTLFIQTGKMASWMAGQLPKNPTYADLMKLNLIKMPKSSPYSPTRTFPTIASFSYTYDSNQNITQRTYPGGTQSFTYDNYDRLTQAVMPDGTYTYTYDSRSNRTTQRFVNTAQTVDQTTSYTYSIDDRLTSYSVLNNLNQQIIRTASYTYDNAGNTTQKQITEGGNTYTTSYTYYDDNRIHTATLPNNDVITYTYHADGTRATKTTPTEYIEYHYAGSLIKEVHMNPSNHSQVYFTLHFQPSRMIYDPLAPGGGDEIKYYTVADTQGTIYKLLDYQGSTVAEYTYDPFGNILTNSAPTIYNPVGFAGTYYEQDTGLLFAQARYFDPTISRFTTKDSYRGDATSTISQNRYIYCHQNPVSFGDPSGFAPVPNPKISTATDLPASSKESLDPPEQKTKGVSTPPAANPGIGETGGISAGQNDGVVEKTEKSVDNSILSRMEILAYEKVTGTVIINGYEAEVIVTIDGKVKVRIKNSSSDPNAKAVEDSINGWLSDPNNKDIVDKMTGRADGIKDLDGMAKRLGENLKLMQWSIDKNFATYQKANPSMSPVELTCSFFRHSFTGVAAANVNFQHEKLMILYEIATDPSLTSHLWPPAIKKRINAGYLLDTAISSGFWASYANEVNHWGLKFNINGQTLDRNAELTICNLSRFLFFQFAYEAGQKPLGFGSIFDIGDEYQNNYMGVKRYNVKLINSTYGLNFSTGFWPVSIFEAMGMGAMFMGMLLNGVSQTFKNPGTSFNLNDLAAAAAVYNGGTSVPNGLYANEIFQSAFGSAFVNLGKKEEPIITDKGNDGRYTVGSLRGAVSAKGKVGKNYKKPIP